MSDSALHIPTLDLSAAPATVVKTLQQACTQHGFFYLAQHGIDSALIAKALQLNRAFFALPEPQKQRYAMKNSPYNRGYDPLKGQRLQADALPDLKESFFLGRDLPLEHPMVRAGKINCGPNQWPQEIADFQTTMTAYMTALTALGHTLMGYLAQSLHLPEDYFRAAYREPLINLRLLHYPPQASTASDKQLGCGAHTDFGSITLLMQDNIGGLQIWQRAQQRWLSAPPVENRFIVNLGDMIARWTNDRYQSSLHRVLNFSGRDRYAMAFFFNCHPDHDIVCLPSCYSPQNPPRYTPIKAGDYIRQRYRETYNVAP